MDQAATWAIRLFLGREPRDQAEIAHYAALGSLAALRRGMLGNPVAAAQCRLLMDGFRVPDFLRDQVTPPSMSRPTSQLCTAAQFDEPIYAAWCRALAQPPSRHRKQWEFVWILAALASADLMRPGVSALGFGTGREVLPAVLARCGLRVVATDAPRELDGSAAWAAGRMHGQALRDLHHPQIADYDTLARQVAWRPVDMNAIPADLRGFDLCWSACALEHLGGIAAGLAFIENSLACLRPGGLAVHTTEFNLSSATETVDEPGLCLFRRPDIEALAARLTAQGHAVWPLNLHPGNAPLDAHVDLPPFAGAPHVKLLVSRMVATSIGIAVRRAG